MGYIELPDLSPMMLPAENKTEEKVQKRGFVYFKNGKLLVANTLDKEIEFRQLFLEDIEKFYKKNILD